MADLPPLSKLPESGVSPELVGQLEHSANWARTFGGSGTNIALRRRHNEDIEQYAGVLQAQREQKQEELLQTSKAAQSLAFGVQRLNLAEETARARMAHDEQMLPLKMEAEKARIAATHARERAVTQAALMKETASIYEDEDTLKFSTAMREAMARGVKPGTPELVELAADTRLANPAMRSEVFDDFWKLYSRSALTPQEGMDQYVAKAVEKKKALMALDPVKPAKPEKLDTYESFNKDLEAAKKAYTTGPLPEFLQKAFEDRGRKLEEQAKNPTAPAPGQPAAAPAPTASPAAAQNQAAIDWVKANPDDPRAAAIRAKLGLK